MHHMTYGKHSKTPIISFSIIAWLNEKLVGIGKFWGSLQRKDLGTTAQD